MRGELSLIIHEVRLRAAEASKRLPSINPQSNPP